MAGFLMVFRVACGRTGLSPTAFAYAHEAREKCHQPYAAYAIAGRRRWSGKLHCRAAIGRTLAAAIAAVGAAIEGGWRALFRGASELALFVGIVRMYCYRTGQRPRDRHAADCQRAVPLTS